MQATFLLLLGLLPPPAAGALRLVRLNCARAGGAADREEAAIVQSIVRHIVLAHEVPDAIARPVEKRVELEQAMLRIDGGKRHHCTLGRLLGADAGHPGGGIPERPLERLDLAQGATRLSGRDRSTESVDSVPRHP